MKHNAVDVNMIQVNEIFNSFQAEGEQVGLPATFVRLANCNLNCEWCDTNFDIKKEYSIHDLTDIIIEENKKIKSFQPLIIFTGGEPFLQYDKISKVIENLMELGYFVSVETNGTIIVPPDPINQQLFYTVSPKEFWEFNKFKQSVVDFMLNFPFVSLKFVINEIEELEYIADYLEEFDLQNEVIYLQPEFSKAEKLINEILINENSKKFNYRFSFQTNKYLNQR